MSEIIEMDGRQDNLQNDLLTQLQNDNYAEFKDTLADGISTRSVDIDHVYAHARNRTLLELACSSPKKSRYVELLLASGANVNLLNPAHGSAPIHLAVINSDIDTVQVLLDHPDINIKKKNDENRTAFHLAHQLKKEDIIELLRGHKAKKIEKAKKDILTQPYKFKKHSLEGISVDSESTRSESPELSRSPSTRITKRLSAFLRRRNYDDFKSTATRENIRRIDYKYLRVTYLQYACKHGLVEVVQLLLELDADPNETAYCLPHKPIELAAFEGYCDIVQLLLPTDIVSYEFTNGRNILQTILKGCKIYELHKGMEKQLDSPLHIVRSLVINVIMNKGADLHSSFSDNVDKARRDHAKCLKLILDDLSDDELDVEFVNEVGDSTPLLLAVRLDNRDMILSLLERGAYIGYENCKEGLPIMWMKPATLEYFLDAGIVYNDILGQFYEYSHNLTFNFNFITCERAFVNEVKPLLVVSEIPHLRPLLKHPFFRVFVDCKWHIVTRKIFHANLFLYVLFVCSFSAYLWATDYVASRSNAIFASTVGAIFWSIPLTSNFILQSKVNITNVRWFFSDLTNLINILLILIVNTILFCHIESITFRGILAAIAIFISYMNLMVIILSHPSLSSVHIDMFTTVALNSLKFLAAYLPLILAFTFSFYILFKATKTKEVNHFKDFPSAVYKTVFMSMGEYELWNIIDYENTNSTEMNNTDANIGNKKVNNSEMNVTDVHNPKVNNSGKSNIEENDLANLIFIPFVFLVPIVLLNLLNAIAVNDIQNIRKDAELASIVARVQFMKQAEEVLIATCLFIDRLIKYYDEWVRGRNGSNREKSLLSHYFHNYSVTRNHYRKIYFFPSRERGCYCRASLDGPLDNDVRKIFIFPTSRRAIQEMLIARSNKKDEVNCQDVTATVTRDAATSTADLQL